VSRLFDHYGQRRGKPLAGDKTPDYVRWIELLHGLWPEARFVHLIRDGRDVATSMRQWVKLRPKPGDFDTWPEDPVSTAAWWWEQNVRLGRRPHEALGPELYCEVRYECLVSRPRETSERLADFLNLPFDEAMLQFHQDHGLDDPGLEATHAGRPITNGLRDWRSEMTADAVERFEAMAGVLLDELGYPRAVPRPGPAALDHAAVIRERLANCPLTCE
jgi:sulfotransferase family protein